MRPQAREQAHAGLAARVASSAGSGHWQASPSDPLRSPPWVPHMVRQVRHEAAS